MEGEGLDKREEKDRKVRKEKSSDKKGDRQRRQEKTREGKS